MSDSTGDLFTWDRTPYMVMSRKYGFVVNDYKPSKRSNLVYCKIQGLEFLMKIPKFKKCIAFYPSSLNPEKAKKSTGTVCNLMLHAKSVLNCCLMKI